ncbi:hypothetical protein ANO11243_075140 [Dothideomycetidae sp. 11243]|nr:hypothetical protein ANO11243_075140 [fungal sp. No.11243]
MGILKHLQDRFNHVQGETVSDLLPYSAIILTTICVVIFFLRLHFFEPFAKWFYGKKYTGLDEVQRRSFINHHVAGSVKLFLVVFAAYPFIALFSGAKKLHSPVGHSSPVKVGDMLLIVDEIFTAIPPMTTVLTHYTGFFDVVAEFWPHLAIIVYRACPDDHTKLQRIFFLSMCLELMGTLVETITVMTIFGSLWSQWTLAFKIITPILHVLFSLAQLWGANVFFNMYKHQKKLAREAASRQKSDTESA